jgi:hypothetical protein
LNIRNRTAIRCSGVLLALASAGTASADEVFPEDLSWWWPQNIERAARLFHCRPAATNDIRQSVMVWTDKEFRVLAFGSALEGGRVPAYASALGRHGSVDARLSVRVATRGHSVISTGRTHALQLNETRLTCLATSDD